MFYTKGSIVGHSDESKTEAIRFEFNCLMADDDLEKVLQSIRDQFNSIGEPLHFKMTLESEDF